MGSYNIRPRDILQVQTKPIQYVSNIEFRYTIEGDRIIALRNEAYSLVVNNGGAIRFNSPSRTLSDNTQLVQHISFIENAIHDNSLEDCCITLSELLPRPNAEHTHPQWTTIADQTYRLMCLYCLYQCVIHLVWHLPISSTEAIQFMRECVQPVGNSTEALCWSFTSYVNLFLQEESIHVLTILNPPTITEVLHTEHLYNALIYQLLMHIAAGNKGVSGSYGVCTACGNTFFRAFKHKKYCEDCDKPSERVKACRAKKRKEAQHAQENNP